MPLSTQEYNYMEYWQIVWASWQNAKGGWGVGGSSIASKGSSNTRNNFVLQKPEINERVGKRNTTFRYKDANGFTA